MEIQSKLVNILNTVLRTTSGNDKYDVLQQGLDFDTNFVEEFDLASLDIMEFNLLIEDQFGIDIEDDDLTTLQTINNIVTCIERVRAHSISL